MSLIESALARKSTDDTCGAASISRTVVVFPPRSPRPAAAPSAIPAPRAPAATTPNARGRFVAQELTRPVIARCRRRVDGGRLRGVCVFVKQYLTCDRIVTYDADVD